MEKRKWEAQLVALGFIALLLIIVVFVLVERGDSGSGRVAHHHRLSTRADRSPTLEQLKEDEFLEIGRVSPEPRPRTHRPYSSATAPQSLNNQPGIGAPVSPTLRPARTTQKPKRSPSAVSRGGGTSSTSSSPRGNSTFVPGVSALAGRNSTGGGVSLAGQNKNKDDKDPVRLLVSPYANDMTKKETKALEEKLSGLPRAIERAVLQAMLPKDKKNANIEKYLNRRYGDPQDASSSAGADNGPFAGVARQISRQKNSIVSSMKNTYGQKAANRAGKVMDSYQKELMSALNQPGQTQEQIAQKTRQISKKYNDQLQEIGQQNALDQLRQEREARDLALQQKLEQSYGPDIAAEAGKILAQYREKELEIFQQKDVSEAEMMRAFWQNEHECDEAVQKMLQSNGKTVVGYQKAKNDDFKERARKRLEQEAEGEVSLAPIIYDKETLDTFVQKVDEKSKKPLDNAEEAFGPQGRARLQAVVDRYKKNFIGNASNTNVTQGDQLEEDDKIREDFQREWKETILELQIDKLHQSPQWQDASEEQRAAWEQQLQESFERRQ